MCLQAGRHRGRPSPGPLAGVGPAGSLVLPGGTELRLLTPRMGGNKYHSL